MGLNLRSILSPAIVRHADLKGETVAIDAYGMFYQFLTMLRDGQGHVLTDDSGNTISHLIGLVSKTQELLDADIYPIYVFDGKPHPLKMGELDRRWAAKDVAAAKLVDARAAGDAAAIRSLSGQTTSVSREMVESATTILEAAGLPYVMAPQDAEAQCAAMVNAGLVHAAASQDYDTLIYGAARVLRNLTSQKRDTEEILLAGLLMETGIQRECLVDLAVLVGNDFHDGIKGVGPKTGLKVLAQYGGMDGFFSACDGGHVPKSAAEKRILAARDELESEGVAAVREIFLNPAVDITVDVRPGKPDATAIHERLHQVHGFSQGRSDLFATSVMDHAERRPKYTQKKLLNA